MIAFQPGGNIKSFTAAASAPTSVTAGSHNKTGSQQYVLTNTDATNDAVIGWGQTDAEAKANAANPDGQANCYYLVHATQVVVTAGPSALFTGIAVASTAVVKVQAGIGN